MNEYKTFTVITECWENGWVPSCDGEYIRTTDYNAAKAMYDRVCIGQDGIEFATSLLASDQVEIDDPYQDFDWQVIETNEAR